MKNWAEKGNFAFFIQKIFHVFPIWERHLRKGKWGGNDD